MIKRYNIEGNYDNECDDELIIDEDKNGKWIKYEDCKGIIEEYNKTLGEHANTLGILAIASKYIPKQVLTIFYREVKEKLGVDLNE